MNLFDLVKQAIGMTPPSELTLKRGASGDVKAVRLPARPVFEIVDLTASRQPNLEKIAKALTRQVVEHARAPAPYGLGIDVEYVVSSAREATSNRGSWKFLLLDAPDQPGLAAYHDVEADGDPIAKLFPTYGATCGFPLSVLLGHEGLETAYNPSGNRCVIGADNRIYIDEVVDNVQKDFYTIDGIQVPNFILPDCWNPPKSGRTPRYDFLGLMKKPGEVRPGGYAQWVDGRGWHEVHGAAAPDGLPSLQQTLGELYGRKKKMAPTAKLVAGETAVTGETA